MTSQDALYIQGTYNTLYNAVSQPDRKFVVSHYFLDEWVPVLGPSLAWLVIALRQRCFWNKRQDWCIVDKATLARDAAMQERTAERNLGKPFSQWFIIKVAHRYRYRTDLGKKVRDKNRYHLLLDEPLSPRHQIGLANLLHQFVAEGPISLDDALTMVQTILNLPDLTDKISYAGTVPANTPRRTILALVEEIGQLNLIDYAADDRAAQLDQACAQLHNKITQPNKIYVGWQYFRLNWLEHLGHSLAWLVINMRRRCFWDEASDELRETCQFFKKDLAQAIGQTPRNLTNLMENQFTALFFKPLPATDEAGRAIQTKGRQTYQIRLVDEPLTPTDQQTIRDELQRRLEGRFLGLDAEQGQLNLFPIIDRASNRQNFSCGQALKIMPGRSRKKGRVSLSINPAELSIREPEAEILSVRWPGQATTSGNQSEELPVRSMESEQIRDGDNTGQAQVPIGPPAPQEILPDRWQQDSRLEPIPVEDLPDRRRQKSRSGPFQAEKMSQHEDRPSGKNVATIKDSLIPVLQQKTQQQNSPDAVADLLNELKIQEPVRSQLLTWPTVTASTISAWRLYTYTQSGLKDPVGYIIKRLLAQDLPPPEFTALARLDPIIDSITWLRFDDLIQSFYAGQPAKQGLPEDLQDLFLQWVELYHGLPPEEVMPFLTAYLAAPVVSEADLGLDLLEAESTTAAAQQIWQTTLNQLALQMTKATFDTWLKHTAGIDYDGAWLRVEVQNPYAKDWLEHRLYKLIERALTNVVGQPVQVEFVIQSQG